MIFKVLFCLNIALKMLENASQSIKPSGGLERAPYPQPQGLSACAASIAGLARAGQDSSDLG